MVGYNKFTLERTWILSQLWKTWKYPQGSYSNVDYDYKHGLLFTGLEALQYLTCFAKCTFIFILGRRESNN